MFAILRKKCIDERNTKPIRYFLGKIYDTIDRQTLAFLLISFS